MLKELFSYRAAQHLLVLTMIIGLNPFTSGEFSWVNLGLWSFALLVVMLLMDIRALLADPNRARKELE